MPAALKPSPFKFGYYYDHDTDKTNRRTVQSYDGERHMVLFGINGSGKSTRILIENLVTIRDRSLVVFDIKGELAAQTHRTRRTLGDVKIVNPYDLHGLGSDGFNPLALFDPDDDDFFDQCKMLTVAMIEVDGSNEFFPRTAQGWFCAGIMWEVIQAQREDRPPSMLRARQICLEPDKWQTSPDGKTQTLVAGVAINARKMVDSGDDQLAGLAARFASDSEARSLQDVLSTLATETEFLISRRISRDLQKGAWTFDQLKEHPTTVYILLPPEQVEDKRRWTRLLVTCALLSHLRPGRVRSLFILDEFRVSLGRLKILNDFWALVRGYGVQFLPVCQSITQLQYLFDKEFENYMGQAGVVATLGAPGDPPTAEWMSRRSGNMTIWQQGYSEGEGEGGPSGSRRNMGENRSQTSRAFKLPEELMSLKDGTGYLWISGRGDRSYAFYAPQWWQRSELAGLVDPNPFRTLGVRERFAQLLPPDARPSFKLLSKLPAPAKEFLFRVDPDLKFTKGIVEAVGPEPRKPRKPQSTLLKVVSGIVALALYIVIGIVAFGAYLNNRNQVNHSIHAFTAAHIPFLLPYVPADPAPPLPVALPQPRQQSQPHARAAVRHHQ